MHGGAAQDGRGLSAKQTKNKLRVKSSQASGWARRRRSRLRARYRDLRLSWRIFWKVSELPLVVRLPPDVPALPSFGNLLDLSKNGRCVLKEKKMTFSRLTSRSVWLLRIIKQHTQEQLVGCKMKVGFPLRPLESGFGVAVSIVLTLKGLTVLHVDRH